MNMFDMLRQAQDGNGIENLARQFGLDQSQTEQVLKSILPAVSTGFKQRARDPRGLESILRQVQGTDYEDVYENADRLGRDDVKRRGDDILGQIFGSKDVSRSVARRAEQSTGVGADIVKKMLPTITSMVLGGMQRKSSQDRNLDGGLGDLVQGMLGGGQTLPSSGGGGLDEILGQVLGQRQPEPEPRRRGGGGLGDILGGILGGGRRSQGREAPQRGRGGLRDIFGGNRGRAARPQPQPRNTGDSLDDLLGGILGASPKQRRGTGNDHLDSVIGMFDSDGDGKVDMDVLRQLARGR